VDTREAETDGTAIDNNDGDDDDDADADEDADADGGIPSTADAGDGGEPVSTDPGVSCGDRMIYDCAGVCGTATVLWDWAADDRCDDGTTFMYDLTCEYFYYDDFACDEDIPASGPE